MSVLLLRLLALGEKVPQGHQSSNDDTFHIRIECTSRIVAIQDRKRVAEKC